MSANPILILPGFGNSGPGHWQTLWERNDRTMQRVQAPDWDHPICAEWVAALEAAVQSSGPRTVLVAHSMGCLQIAHWAAQTSLRIQGALLVAVPDPVGPAFPVDAIGFAPVPMQRFAFPSTVVASTDDPYGGIDHARRCAQAWGSRLVDIGAAGHINADSGLGDWPAGKALLGELLGRSL